MIFLQLKRINWMELSGDHAPSLIPRVTTLTDVLGLFYIYSFKYFFYAMDIIEITLKNEVQFCRKLRTT